MAAGENAIIANAGSEAGPERETGQPPRLGAPSCDSATSSAGSRPAAPAPLARLLKRPDFLRAAGAGRKCAMPGLVLQAYNRKDGRPRSGDRSAAARALDPAAIRFGLTVSKKVGNAVERNRVRRRLRALARETLPRLGEHGTDYVLIGRAASLDRSFPDLRCDLEKALKRLAGKGPSSNGGRHEDRRGSRRTQPERRKGDGRRQ